MLGYCAAPVSPLLTGCLPLAQEEVFLQSTGAAHQGDPASIPQGNIANRIDERVQREVAAESPSAQAPTSVFANVRSVIPHPFLAQQQGQQQVSSVPDGDVSLGGRMGQAGLSSNVSTSLQLEDGAVSHPVHDASPSRAADTADAASTADEPSSYQGNVQELHSVPSTSRGEPPHSPLQSSSAQHKSSDDSEPSTLSHTPGDSPRSSTASVKSPGQSAVQASSGCRNEQEPASIQRRQQSMPVRCWVCLTEMLKKRANIAGQGSLPLAFLAGHAPKLAETAAVYLWACICSCAR